MRRWREEENCWPLACRYVAKKKGRLCAKGGEVGRLGYRHQDDYCYKGPFRLYNLSVGFTILNIPSCSLSYYSGFLCFKLEVFRYFSREKMPSICSNFLQYEHMANTSPPTLKQGFQYITFRFGVYSSRIPNIDRNYLGSFWGLFWYEIRREFSVLYHRHVSSQFSGIILDTIIWFRDIGYRNRSAIYITYVK